jgi:hypothetical protein
MFHRSLTIPLWAVAFCAVALATPSVGMPPLTAMIAIVIIASMTMATARWGCVRQVLVDVRPMASGDGFQVPRGQVLLAGPIPGARETGMLTTFDISVVDVSRQDEASSMDAVTTAERQREGGGAPSQRRPSGGPWSARHELDRFVTAARALFVRRLRINHV